MMNRTKICGIKPSTDPTPPITPSTTKDSTAADAPVDSRPLVAAVGIESTNVPKSCGSGSSARPLMAFLKSLELMVSIIAGLVPVAGRPSESSLVIALPSVST